MFKVHKKYTQCLCDNNNGNNGGNTCSVNEIATLGNNINSIVNVEFLKGGENDILLRFDVMSLCDDNGRYSSITYDLTTKSGTVGLFDFFEDYYSKKFNFFLSGKRNQAFMLAMYRIEKNFNKYLCYDFKEYCETINSIIFSKYNNDLRFSNILGNKIVDGYSVSDEPTKLYRLKHEHIKIGNHIEQFGIELQNEFCKILDEMDKTKFCCVCINNTEKIPPSFLMDPLINLPFVVYHSEFAELFLKKNFKDFIESELFKSAEIYEIVVDMWAIAPEITIKNLISVVGEDGEVNFEYTDECMEDTDMFLGKYKTIKFDNDSYKNDNFEQTIIGYN